MLIERTLSCGNMQEFLRDLADIFQRFADLAVRYRWLIYPSPFRQYVF
jgi:hypothetical protein